MLRIKKYRLRFGPVAADLFADRAWTQLNQPCVVTLPGFPDFAGSNALTVDLVRNGCMVLQPHLLGTYDSDEIFSPENCQRTLALTGEALATSGWRMAATNSPAELDLKPSTLSLIGHSFGGVSALRWFHELGPLKLLAFTSAALHYRTSEPDYGCKEIGSDHYREVSRSHPHTYRLAPFESWNAILTGTDALPSSTRGAAETVRAVYGQQDKYFNIDAVKANVPDLLRSYVAASTSSEVVILPEGGHPVAEIVQASPVTEIFPELFS